MIETENRFDKLRYPLAVGLSTGIILLWYFVYSPNPKVPEDAGGSNAETSEQTAAPMADELLPEVTSADDVLLNDLPQAATAADTAVPLNDAVETVVLSNAVMKLQFSTDDAVVTAAEVLNGTNEEAQAAGVWSEDFEAMGLPGFFTGKVFFSETFPSLSSASVQRIIYTVVAVTENSVTMQTQLKGQRGIVTVEKYYELNDAFELKLRIRFSDEQGRPVRVPYHVLNGANLGDAAGTKKSPFDIKRLSYQRGNDNDTILDASFFGSDQTFSEITGAVDWLALDNRFYARVLKAAQDVQLDKAVFAKRSTVQFDGREDFYMAGALQVSGDGDDEFTFYYFPKNRAVLNDYYERTQEHFFSLFHQFSFMRILSSIMYWLLQQINIVLNSYGWSILVMTILVKLAILPLTHRGMRSMYRMQQLSPKLEAIKAQYKAHPQKLNAEMMLLYRKEKVSPLGGCLPMLLPIPIFIALYSLFQNMVELRDVSFFWIRDLSIPDTIYKFSFDLPLLGNELNLLPILMTTTALGQALLPSSPQQSKAKLSSASPTAQSMQKQMMMMKYIFPVMFFFICWNLPSALVFFWTIQNVFSFFQALYTRKALNFSGG